MMGLCGLLCVVSGACFVLVCLAFWIVFGLGGWVGPGLVFWTVVLIGEGSWLAVLWLVGVSCFLVLFGEFDPGSGRTLAACLTHASRTVKGPALVGPG